MSQGISRKKGRLEVRAVLFALFNLLRHLEPKFLLMLIAGRLARFGGVVCQLRTLVSLVMIPIG